MLIYLFSYLQWKHKEGHGMSSLEHVSDSENKSTGGLKHDRAVFAPVIGVPVSPGKLCLGSVIPRREALGPRLQDVSTTIQQAQV